MKCFAGISDSPVEQIRKELPRGDGNWAGFESCYSRLQVAASKMALNGHLRGSQEHIEVMAAMGSGHEETMKHRIHWCYTFGWL